jgi:hypothetical protein
MRRQDASTEWVVVSPLNVHAKYTKEAIGQTKQVRTTTASHTFACEAVYNYETCA